jgi:hypothetical protein
VYADGGTGCNSHECPNPGACCLPSGECAEIDFAGAECAALDGVFQGPLTTCRKIECPVPRGACCVGALCRSGQTMLSCQHLHGEWAGADTSCFLGLCPLCDDGDSDQDGDVDLRDFADHQTCFQRLGTGSCKCLDMNNDNVVDLLDSARFVAAITGP